MNLTLAKVVRLPTASPICTSLILFSFFAVAFAFPSAVSAGDTGVSWEQQLAQAQAIVSRGEQLHDRIGEMKSQAQRDKDIIRVNCLDTKHDEVNANLTNAKRRLESLRNEVDPQRRRQALTVMLVLGQKFDVLDQQANQCIGQNVFDTTRSNNALDSTNINDACDSNPCEAGESCKPDSTQPKGYKCESSGPDLAPLPPPVTPDLIVPTSAPNTTVTIMAKGDQQKVMENAETPLTFTVSLDTAASKSLSIPYTISGTDITADDFSGGLTGNVAIAVGESSTDLMLSVKNDDVVEKDETFTITLGPAPEGVTLGDNKSASGTILNDDVNRPPVAQDDAITLDADSRSTVVRVLENDTDPDKDELTVTRINKTNTKAIVVLYDGVISYDPNNTFDDVLKGQTEVDIFSYTISDGSNETATATVTVTINGLKEVDYCADDPCQNGGQCSSDVENETFQCVCTVGYLGKTCADAITPAAGTLEADYEELAAGDVAKINTEDWKSASGGMSFEWNASCTGGLVPGEFTGKINTCAAGWTGTNCEQQVGEDLTARNNNELKDATLGYITFKAPDNNTGEAQVCTITVTGTDPANGIATEPRSIEITVESKNLPPVAKDLSVTIEEDTTNFSANRIINILSYTDSALDALPDNDKVANEQLRPDIKILKQPKHGRLSISFVSNDYIEIAKYTPNPNWSGTDTFSYQVTSAVSGLTSNEATTTIIVTPVNDAPRKIEGVDPIVELDEGEEITIDVSKYFSDIDGDALTISSFTPVSSEYGTLSQEGSSQLKFKSNKPIDKSGDKIAQSYKEFRTATDVTVTDGKLKPSSPVTIRILINNLNDPPSLVNQLENDVFEVYANSSVDISPFHFVDPDSSWIVKPFSVQGLPESLRSINSYYDTGALVKIFGNVREEDVGIHEITVTATDPGGLTAIGKFDLIVLEQPKPAIITGETTGNIIEDDKTTTTGTLEVEDTNEGESEFKVASNIAGKYGSLEIDKAGKWTYTVTDMEAEVIQSLSKDESLTDKLTVESKDGTKQDIIITITGVDEPALEKATIAAKSSESNVVQKEVSVSPDYEETTDSDGNKSLIFTVTLSCPADRPVECLENTCAVTAADCGAR